MATITHKQLSQIRLPGTHPAGPNLLLQIRVGAGDRITKSWLARVTVRVAQPDGSLRSVRRAIGLGSFDAVGLADARRMAAEARALAREGKDPVEERDRALVAQRLAEQAAARAAELEAARKLTFEQAALAFIEAKRSSWTNEKHAKQWMATLRAYAFPVFGDVPVEEVDMPLVTKVLDPIWTEKPETARRLRARIEHVLDWASVRGHRDAAKRNPATWEGVLQHVYAPRGGALRVKHHPALPFAELPAFIDALQVIRGDAADALLTTILTATRTSEAIGAAWSEVDLDAAVWTIPEERMKAGKAHRVPLSAQAVELLQRRHDAAKRMHPKSDLVFPGARYTKPLSNMAMLALLRRMDRSDITVHGFRSTFRDWAAEKTSFPNEVCEACLAHAIGNKVEAAYRRGDLFEKRRRLMQAWADYAVRRTHAADVVALPIKGSGNAKRAVP